jgi:hypothetical protein
MEGEGATDTGPSLSKPGRPAARGKGRKATTVRISRGSDGVKFTIDPGEVKPDQKVFITTATGTVNSIAMAIATHKPTAPCPPQPATP